MKYNLLYECNDFWPNPKQVFGPLIDLWYFRSIKIRLHCLCGDNLYHLFIEWSYTTSYIDMHYNFDSKEMTLRSNFMAPDFLINFISKKVFFHLQVHSMKDPYSKYLYSRFPDNYEFKQ